MVGIVTVLTFTFSLCSSSSLCRGGHRRPEAELSGSVVRTGELWSPNIGLHPRVPLPTPSTLLWGKLSVFLMGKMLIFLSGGSFQPCLHAFDSRQLFFCSRLHQIDPHPDQATSTAEQRLDTCPSRWEMHGMSPKQLGFRSFHFCLSPDDSDCSLCCHHQEKTKPPWRNPYVRVQEVTGKLPDPEIRPPHGWDMPHRTKPAELCQSSHFSHAFQENVDKEHADLVRDLKRNARKHYDRSHSQYIWEKCVILLPQFLISVCTFVFLTWVLKSLIVLFQFSASWTKRL